MPMLNFHPAPGLGDLLPGWHSVPQNPLRPDSTPLVPTVRAATGNAITVKPKMGDLLPGKFTVPQNPIRKNLMSSMGMAGMGCGCGCDRMSGPPAVAMGSYSPHLVDVNGSTPYRFDFPPMGDDNRVWFQPMAIYGQPSSEDMQSHGMAGLTMDGTGLLGTGLFSGGMNFSTWGTGEYVVAGLGAYTLFSLFSTGKRHAGVLRRKARAAYTTNPRRRRNVEQGFWRGGRFHPIRASDDYEPDTVGERYQYAPKKKKRSRR